MEFKPFDRMLDKVETQKDISHTDYFNSLMYLGEMVVKFAVAGMVAAVNEGQDRHQYRLRKQLVEANGIGDWSKVLDEVLSGVAAQYLCNGVKGEGNETYQLTKEDNFPRLATQKRYITSSMPPNRRSKRRIFVQENTGKNLDRYICSTTKQDTRAWCPCKQSISQHVS